MNPLSNYLLLPLWRLVGQYGHSSERLMWSREIPNIEDGKTLEKLDSEIDMYILEEEFVLYELTEVVWWYVHQPKRSSWYIFTKTIKQHAYLLQHPNIDYEFIKERFDRDTEDIYLAAIRFGRTDILETLDQREIHIE